MDGFAVRVADLSGQAQRTERLSLAVQDRLAAGDGRQLRLAPDAAIQVFTGAAIPEGADAVVMQEQVRRVHGRIFLEDCPQPGLNIRLSGEDMAKGIEVLSAGKKMTARDVAVAAAAGAGSVQVTRKLRVALLVTGTEVRAPGMALDAATIWDVNTPMLAAMLRRPLLDLVAVEHGADHPGELTLQIGRMAQGADLVVTTGGVSVGQEDHLHAAVSGAGGEIAFAGVAIKPGKPVSVGRIGGALWIGLPGNPVSSFVTWTLFGEAMLDGLSHAAARPSRRNVIIGTDIHHKPGRCELRPARHAGFDGSGRDVVTFDSATHSARVHGFAAADGLLLIPAEVDFLRSGSLVEFVPFRDAV
tara:strand:- start:556 stop:1629 length:1074 start_codon:yes stop_codon:yes gene_type:complete